MFIAHKDLEFKSSVCDGNSLKCSGAVICSDSKSPQLQIAIHRGGVVDAIEVNGKRFGTKSSDNKIDVPIQHGDSVQQMTYGIGRDWTGQRYNNAICGLYLITREETFGPYASNCESEYTVIIPEDVTLPEFLKSELTVTDQNWPSGFRNQNPI